jgi:hypothetical protein
MIEFRTFRDAPRPAAVLVRIMAFMTAGISAIIIPCDLAAAAVGHVPVGHALAIAGVMAALTLATVVLARGVDPLRN